MHTARFLHGLGVLTSDSVRLLPEALRFNGFCDCALGFRHVGSDDGDGDVDGDDVKLR